MKRVLVDFQFVPERDSCNRAFCIPDKHLSKYRLLHEMRERFARNGVDCCTIDFVGCKLPYDYDLFFDESWRTIPRQRIDAIDRFMRSEAAMTFRDDELFECIGSGLFPDWRRAA